ncbi:MAG: HU family DNA-binding protein [Paludibacter sp.]|jgi:DNA-binding protein HU-beta|nr:HU family DNA-binding protein [Paludibacter sp.]
MKHKELITAIAMKLDRQEADVEQLLHSSVERIKSLLVEGQSVALQGLGVLEVKRKEERLSVHPMTKVRTMIPPKQVVGFKQSPTMKSKLKELPNYE